MIIFAELNKSGFSHVSINRAMLEILLSRYNPEQIKIFAERNHANNILNGKLINNVILTNSIHVVDGGYLLWPYKLLLDFFNLIKIFSAARKSKVDFIFIASIFPLSHFFFLMIRFFYKKTKVILCLHGELQHLLPRSFKDKILGYFLNINLKKSNDNNTVFMVYSEIIKTNLSILIPDILDRIIVIDHPYDYKYVKKCLKIMGPICIGSIGVASLSKKSHLIFDLAYNLKQYVEFGSIKFKIVGRLNSDISNFYNDYVTRVSNDNMLPVLEYHKEIESLDFFIFFYGNDLYSLSPSGVFFDAMEYEKPIIAIKNDFFNYYFERFGDIGYLSDNKADMGNLIAGLSQNFNTNKYNQQVKNIQKAKLFMSINTISIEFWKSYEHLSIH
jgi:hypothetical protein